MASITITAAVAAVASAGVAAYSSHEQGVAVANADKRKARIESDSEGQKQINMRTNMLKALATQNAAAGAAGGSVNRAGALRQITEAQNDVMISRSNSSAQVSLLDQAASNARAAGDLGAVGDIAGGISTGISAYRGPGPSPSSPGSNSGGGPG